MAKVLLVEDDDVLASFLVRSLRSRLYDVDRIDNGQEGLQWLENSSYDVAVLDWELPGMSGISICQTFRGNGGTTPILILTGKGQVVHKVAGLDAGADDYLAKPFDIEELHARLRALIRRKEKADITSAQIAIGKVLLNTELGEVRVDGQRVQVTHREFAILELLMENPNRTMSAEIIVRKAWPSDSDTSPEVVRSHITRLRNKLKAVADEAGNLIKSNYGSGYRVESEP